ncbi:MAG TPA: hypothetical protein VGB77_11485, partial [Abditibacteriaceae bacterium]
LKICRELGNCQDEGVTLNNLAELWERQGNFARALLYGRQSVSVLETTQDKAELERAHLILARIEAELLDEAQSDVAESENGADET